MNVKIIATVNGKDYKLLPLTKAARNNGYSVSYVRFMADTGQIIATKMSGRWFVSETLEKHNDLAPVLER